MRVRITKCPTAENGLQVEDNQYSHVSPSMIMLGGDSHAEGGTDVNYGGKTIEAEKGEPVSIDKNNSAVIWGNMSVPGTGKKFKSIAKSIGEQENKMGNLNTRAETLLQNNDPQNKFQRLGFNAGRIMQIGAAMGQGQVNKGLETLGNLQKAMLATAQEHNLDPQEMSKGNMKKAKKGLFIKMAKDGYDLGGSVDPNNPGEPGNLQPDGSYIGGDNPVNPPTKQGTRSDRLNNPGNMMYVEGAKWMQKLGATKGDERFDKNGKSIGNYAQFPNRDSGFAAMQAQLLRPKYKDMPANQIIPTWVGKGEKPYDYNLGDIGNKTPAQMTPEERSQFMGVMTKGEGTKYGSEVIPTSFENNAPKPGVGYKPIPYDFTDTPLNTNIPLTADGPGPTPQTATPPNTQPFRIPDDAPLPTNAQNLNLLQILPEIYAGATNKQVPVALQKYVPQLYTPYQMSFQDQLNDNQDTFNATRRQLAGSNPAALSTLNAGEYTANNRVRAEEFRTNQGIQADTINKNVALNNDAQLKNLQLADTQYTRQSQAASNTKALNNMVMRSIADKFQQNTLQNKTLQAYENLYDYRFNPNNGQANYYGPDAQFNNAGNPIEGQGGQNTRTVVERDRNGNIIKTRAVTASPLDTHGKQLINQQREEDLGPMKKFYKNFGHLG